MRLAIQKCVETVATGAVDFERFADASGKEYSSKSVSVKQPQRYKLYFISRRPEADAELVSTH